MSEIYVTAAQLKAKAEELSAQNNQLKAQIELLDETEQSLNAMWEGDANTAFHAAFQRDKAQLTNFYNAIGQYAAVLQNAAARYAQAESQNVDIANTRKY
jgi:WXG100 family type VII secretion target